jgi:molecular chaperone GrpE
MKNLDKLKQELSQSQEREKRAVADYQNLIRRQAQERLEIIKLASGDLLSELLQPLDHLSLAAKQINDQGLNMVIAKLWEVLRSHGLEEINPQLGDKFDLETMEVVESSGEIANEGKDHAHQQAEIEHENTVVKLVTRGYRLNGKVIKHAKVIVN